MSKQVTNVVGYILLPENNRHTFRGVAILLAEYGFPPEMVDQIQPFIEHNFWKEVHYLSFDYKQQKVSVGTRPLHDQIKTNLPYTGHSVLYVQGNNYSEIVARAKLLGIKADRYRKPAGDRPSRDIETRAKELGR